jgi:hypothetical protein
LLSWGGWRTNWASGQRSLLSRLSPNQEYANLSKCNSSSSWAEPVRIAAASKLRFNRFCHTGCGSGNACAKIWAANTRATAIGIEASDRGTWRRLSRNPADRNRVTTTHRAHAQCGGALTGPARIPDGERNRAVDGRRWPEPLGPRGCHGGLLAFPRDVRDQ